MKEVVKKVYNFLFMPFVPLKKINAPAKIFILPSFIIALQVLLVCLIIFKIGHYDLDTVQTLYFLIFLQALFYVIFLGVLPLNLDYEELKREIGYSTKGARSSILLILITFAVLLIIYFSI